jgi:hypothetical protein
MNVYFWKDAKDGKFHLYDLTTPSRPHEQTLDAQPTSASLATFFEEVARYPEGLVRYTLPGGGAGVAATTGKTKWYEWVGYAGLAIAVVGLGVLTAGANILATVCFAAGAIAGGLSARRPPGRQRAARHGDAVHRRARRRADRRRVRQRRRSGHHDQGGQRGGCPGRQPLVRAARDRRRHLRRRSAPERQACTPP